MKKLFFVLALSLATTCVHAESPYQKGEVTLDAFATYTDAKAKFNDAFDTSYRGGQVGFGVAGAYWFHRNFSLGADLIVPDGGNTSGGVFEHVNLNLGARVPIGDSPLALHAVTGAGRLLEADHWTTHAALGWEWRFTKHIGAFGEGRFTWVDNATDELQCRLGVRFKF